MFMEWIYWQDILALHKVKRYTHKRHGIWLTPDFFEKYPLVMKENVEES